MKILKAIAMCFICYNIPYFLGMFTKNSLFFSPELLIFIGGSIYGGHIQKHIFTKKITDTSSD